MFCHITANWRGRPLTSYQVVLETIAATTTATGLRIGAELDTGDYALGTTVTTAEFHAPCRSHPMRSTATGITFWPRIPQALPKHRRLVGRSIPL